MTKNLGKFDTDLFNQYGFKVRKRKGKWHVDSFSNHDLPWGDVFDTRQQAVDHIKEMDAKCDIPWKDDPKMKPDYFKKLHREDYL